MGFRVGPGEVVGQARGVVEDPEVVVEADAEGPVIGDAGEAVAPQAPSAVGEFVEAGLPFHHVDLVDSLYPLLLVSAEAEDDDCADYDGRHEDYKPAEHS